MLTSLRLTVSFGSNWHSLVGLLGTLNAKSSFLVDSLVFFEEVGGLLSKETAGMTSLETFSAKLPFLRCLSVLFPPITFSPLLPLLFTSGPLQEIALTVTVFSLFPFFAGATGSLSSTKHAWIIQGCSCGLFFDLSVVGLLSSTGVATIVTMLSSPVVFAFFTDPSAFSFCLLTLLSCSSCAFSFASQEFCPFFLGFGVGWSPLVLSMPSKLSTLPFLSLFAGTGVQLPSPSSSVDELCDGYFLSLVSFWSPFASLILTALPLSSGQILLSSWLEVGGSGAFLLINDVVLWSTTLVLLLSFISLGGEGAFLLAGCCCSPTWVSSEFASMPAILGGLGGGNSFSFLLLMSFSDAPFSNTLLASASFLGVCGVLTSLGFLSLVFSCKHKLQSNKFSAKKSVKVNIKLRWNIHIYILLAPRL